MSQTATVSDILKFITFAKFLYDLVVIAVPLTLFFILGT